MTGRVSVTDHGDAELLARARTGDVVARDALLDRHRAAVARVGDPDATARAALAADDFLPFRAAWLALTATGTLPPPGWALDDLPRPWRTAVWHHLVEGEPLSDVALAAGTTEARVGEQLRGAYDDLGPDRSAYRRQLAVRVLGPHAAAYLSDRPDPVPLRRRALRDPAIAAVALSVAAGLVTALYVVPMGGRWTEGRLDATVQLPGTLLVPAASVEDAAGSASVVSPGFRLRPLAPASTATEQPTPQTSSQPPTGPPPVAPPPDDDPGPPPGTPVALPGGLGQVTVADDHVEVEVHPPGQDPVTVEIPLPLPEPLTLG